MKKAILIQPPIEDFYLTHIRTYPLNLCYLGNILEKQGLDVEIVDMLDGGRKILPFPDEFSELKSYYLSWDKSPYSLFKHYQRFGYSKEKVENIVKNLKGDYFLIPSNFTAYFEMTCEVAVAVRKFHKDAVIITGGYHASATPQEVEKTGLFDFVIVGEGEEGLIRVLEGSKKKIIFSEKFGEFNKSVPARHLLNSNRYIINKKKATTLTVSRGCPMHCEFCTIHSVYKHKYRKREVGAIISEIRDCNKRDGIEHFDFEDDNLSGVFLNSFLDEILKMNLTNCSFSAMNGIPYLGLNEEILVKMIKVGFTHLDISLGAMEGIMQRATNLNKFEHVVEIADSLQLPVNAYFILGLPELSFEDNFKIIEYLARLNLNIGPSVYYTVPGIPYYENKIPNIQCRSTAIYTFNESKLSKKQVILLFRLCRAINFLKKKNKTDFEKQVDRITKLKGLKHVKKIKKNYSFLDVQVEENKKIIQLLNSI